MKNWSSISVTVLVAFLFLTSCYLTAEETGESRYPQPGATGNAGNIPFIGKKDAQGNPVRLARRTGHVSNYDEAKVKDYTLPDPLRCSDGTSVKRPPICPRRLETVPGFCGTTFCFPDRINQSGKTLDWCADETDAAHGF